MPVIVNVMVNGHSARALIDSGSLTDFVSTTLADQLRLKLHEKEEPLTLQLAITGSRSKVNVETRARFQYQNIDEERTFEVANVDTYDMILGTKFMWEHEVLIGLNPTRVHVGSAEAKELRGPGMVVLSSARTEVLDQRIEDLRKKIFEEAADLFKTAAKEPLPPLRAINLEIPLLDEKKVYPYRASRCPVIGQKSVRPKIATFDAHTVGYLCIRRTGPPTPRHTAAHPPCARAAHTTLRRDA